MGPILAVVVLRIPGLGGRGSRQRRRAAALTCPQMEEQLSDHAARRMRRLCSSAQSAGRLPSLVVAVGRHGRILNSVCLGSADLSAATPPGLDVQYRVGSITKTFTAVAVMQIVAEGLADLADPIGRHWAGAPHPELTIGALLTHTSGLQRERAAEAGGPTALPARGELAQNLAKARLLYPSGHWWHYSNLGFAVLGEVVAQVRGESWELQVTERILRPLGMSRTSLFAEAPSAQGYSVQPFSDAVKLELPTDSGAIAPAGQLWSTAIDLTKWVAFLIQGDPRVLPQDQLELMRAPRVIADLEHWTTAFGLGVALRRRGERTFVGHTGGMPGFLAVAYGSPATGNSVVVFTNSTAGLDVGDFGAQLLELADEDTIDSTIWEAGGDPPTEYATVLGSWWSEWSETIFTWRGGLLQSSPADAPPGTPPDRYRRVGADLFITATGSERGEELQLVRDEGGTVVKMYHATYPLTRMAAGSADEQGG